MHEFDQTIQPPAYFGELVDEVGRLRHARTICKQPDTVNALKADAYDGPATATHCYNAQAIRQLGQTVSTTAISYSELGDALVRAQAGVGAADLHGSLAGYLCGGGSADARHWFDALELSQDEDAAKALPPPLLEQLYRDCATWLADPELGFEPLLPGPETPIDARAEALVEWCRGFLGGFGLAGAGHDGTLSRDAREILADFDTIAATHFEHAGNEDDEAALAEMIEFIRVGALLLHAELHAAPQSGATLH
ncbi:MAG: UPF0149 family protein [Rudaea sp.]|nr:UPF0149 family protein [Rudaea sp.]MBR0344506.1 UPF0149 family protein [Rudaea sp.]